MKFSWLLFLLGLAGCMMGPTYHEVSHKVQERWQPTTSSDVQATNIKDLST